MSEPAWILGILRELAEETRQTSWPAWWPDAKRLTVDQIVVPVRQLPDGTIRIGHEPPATKEERFPFPVVPNVVPAHTIVAPLPNKPDKPKVEP